MIKQLSLEEAEQLIADGSLVIIDVRNEDSFKQGRLHKDAIWLSAEGMKNFCQTTSKNQPILVYCYHGISSQAVGQYLLDQGFLTVYSLIGGFEKWQMHHQSTSDRQSE